MKAAVYARVSSTKQAEQGFSLDTQEQGCRAYCQRMGFEVVQVEKDAYSGAAIYRPGLDAVRSSMAEGKLGAVVILELDRLFRNLIAQSLFVTDLREAGVELHVVNAGGRYDYDAPMNKLLLVIAGAFNEFRRDMIKEAAVRGKRNRANRGLVTLNDVAPYGYSMEEGRLAIVPEEAKVVSGIITRYAKGDVSLERIARDLEGTPSPTDTGHGPAGFAATRKVGPGVWSSSMIKRIISNRTYSGQWSYGQTRSVEVNRGSGGMEKKRVRNGDTVSVEVPPIVTPELQQRAIDKLGANRSRRDTNRRRRLYLMGSFLRCGICGKAYSGITTIHNKTEYPYYRCSGKLQHGDKCTAPSVRAEWLEAQAKLFVKAIVTDPEFTTGLARWWKERQAEETGAGPRRLKAVEDKLALLESRRLKLLAMGEAAGDVDSAREIGRRLAEIGKEQSALKGERRDLLAAPKIVEFDEKEFGKRVGAIAGIVVASAGVDRDKVPQKARKLQGWLDDYLGGEEEVFRLARAHMRDIQFRAVVQPNGTVDFSAKPPMEGGSIEVQSNVLAFWSLKRPG